MKQLVYRCPGPHFAHAGQTYAYKPVPEDAVAAALEDGWHLSLLDAVNAALGIVKPQEHAPSEQEQDGESAPPREELEKMAAELGIRFDGRNSDAGLWRKVQDALNEAG